MRRLTFVLVAAVSTIALAQVASAADLGRPVYKAPPPPAAPVQNWTGWYVGLNAGYGWENTIDDSASGLFCDPLGAFCPTPPPPGFTTPSGALAAAVPPRFDTHPKGFIGGGQIGYNYQFAPNWVAGVETDFQGADIKGDETVGGSALAGAIAPFIPVNVTGTGSQKLDWFGTLRGRLGWVPVNPLLIYATGGLAYGHTETNVSFSASTAGQPVAFVPCAPGPCTGSSRQCFKHSRGLDCRRGTGMDVRAAVVS